MDTECAHKIWPFDASRIANLTIENSAGSVFVVVVLPVATANNAPFKMSVVKSLVIAADVLFWDAKRESQAAGLTFSNPSKILESKIEWP